MRFTKELAPTIPPGRQEPGRVERYAEDELEPTQALKTDCADVIDRVFGDSPPPFFEGFVVLRSRRLLEVQAVYSAAALEEAGPQAGGDVDVRPSNRALS